MIHVNARVTQNFQVLSFDTSVPHNATLTALELARSMEEEQPRLRALDGLTLVSPSPSEAQNLIIAPPHPSLQLTWSLPPNMQLFEELSKRVSNLEKEDKIKAEKISNLEIEDGVKARQISSLQDHVADIKPLADAIHLRGLLDAWLREQGFGTGSGPRKAWIHNNKTRLSVASGIPEADLEDFLEHRFLGDTYAHVVKSDRMARSITLPQTTTTNYTSLGFSTHSSNTLLTTSWMTLNDWKITTLK
ncbi:uncharacterized protein LACBIDRAFT_325308 [Laccaria bicolor S238N-H82]|uniref:Predicted protein n=1 Tax=Laccaria bicolor (strain S238N-H82 / ATCC MYA-4686) TaxID=486041 RepID=B0D4H8_LACBS|nr:uncharacterized protein LACBIDRAFT_325308 [Laccaria bicolor S238N-H82]EDR10346.1 predicted protein [Laccaria bicolor S238N-H82]|eukprot:XP_001878796.1 predicted protein [Laccaria bicolor S238N-H82]